VDILVNDLSEEVWNRTLAVCLKSVFLCSKAALKGMVGRRAGVIINISSVNALTGIHLAAYTAAKGGNISLTRVLATQYGGFGVRINTICPGTILSESSRLYYEANPEIAAGLAALYPARKFGTTSHIVSAALFLASDEATFINGTAFALDRGLSAVHQLPAISKND
jgi:NAD(P)-dependent dehydrogenase (short-subunit alcohol dehydrogenase family)